MTGNSEDENGNENEEAGKNLFKADATVRSFRVLTPAEDAILKGIYTEVKTEFSDTAILKSEKSIDLGAYIGSGVWIVVSVILIYWLHDSIDNFEPEKYKMLSPRDIWILVILQRLAYTGVVITLIITLYKFSRYLYAQSIEYRYSYLSYKIKIATFLSTLRNGGSFSDSFIKELVSKNRVDHEDHGDATIFENMINKFTSLLKTAIEKLGGK